MFGIKFLSKRDKVKLQLLDFCGTNSIVVNTDMIDNNYFIYGRCYFEIDFKRSFLQKPNVDFWLKFHRHISLLTEDLKAIPWSFLLDERFTSSIYEHQFEELIIINSENKKLKEKILNKVNQNHYFHEGFDWGLIFTYIKFNTLELLQLENVAIKHLKVVCEHQKINDLLRERWKDQEDFFDTSVPKELEESIDMFIDPNVTDNTTLKETIESFLKDFKVETHTSQDVSFEKSMEELKKVHNEFYNKFMGIIAPYKTPKKKKKRRTKKR